MDDCVSIVCLCQRLSAQSVLVQKDVRECVMAPLDDSNRDGRRLQALLHKCDVPLRHVRKGRAERALKPQL